MSTLDRVPGGDFSSATQGGADDVADIVKRVVRLHRAGLDPGHVEQIGDEAVQPLGFVDHRREQLAAVLFRQRLRELLQRARRAHDRGERRLQIVRDRGQQRRAQPVGLGRELGPVDIGDKLDALDGDRRLVGQRIEQPLLLGRQQRTLLVVVETDDADRRASGPQREIEPLGARQRVGAAAGGAVVLPGPARRGDVGIGQRVVGRIAGLDGDRAVFRQQQHHAQLEHGGDLEGGRPQHVVERAGAGQLLAEQIEIFRRAGALARGHRLALDARRQIAGDDGDARRRSRARRRFPDR